MPTIPPGRPFAPQAVHLLSSLAIFLCVFYAIRADDWRRMALLLGAAALVGLGGQLLARRL